MFECSEYERGGVAQVCGLITPLSAVGDEEVARERKQQFTAAGERSSFLVSSRKDSF